MEQGDASTAMPAGAYTQSCTAAHQAHHDAARGLVIDGDVEVDLGEMQVRWSGKRAGGWDNGGRVGRERRVAGVAQGGPGRRPWPRASLRELLRVLSRAATSGCGSVRPTVRPSAADMSNGGGGGDGVRRWQPSAALAGSPITAADAPCW